MTDRERRPPEASPLYSAIEPSETGLLDVDDHRIYWESCGAPNGRPALVLHGGPGSGCTAAMRRYFDPSAYRIVLADQRNCGRSTPSASDPSVDLSTNTTAHLIDDLVRLRAHLGVDRWTLLGFSWGSTLGLAYAEAHPDHVAAIVLSAVATTRRSEIDWLYGGVGQLFPVEYGRFCAGAGESDRDPLHAYHRLLADPDPAVRAKAALDFTEWEWAVSSVAPTPLAGRWADRSYQYGRARIVTHYFVNGAFLPDGVVLRDAHRLAGIPGVLIHGRFDLGCPLVTPWELSLAWPESELVVVGQAGHSAGDPGMAEAIVAATDRFR